MTTKSIKTAIEGHKDQKKRRGELFLALGAFLLIVLLSWIELRFFGINSYLFLVIFNLNLILLLVILFLVIRNSVKLFLERRRKIQGSRLRTKLVFAFISLSLVPIILMFFVATKFVRTSVEYWFSSNVENSMELSLEVGKSFYANTQNRLEKHGNFIVQKIRNKHYLWGGKGMDYYLRQKYKEYNLSLIGILTPNLSRQNWYTQEEWEENWPKIKQNIDWNNLKKEPKFLSKLISGSDKDLVVGILPVDEAETGFLVLGSTIKGGMLTKLNKIVTGVEEYKQLKVLKDPLKLVYYLVLGVMTLLIIFGAMWFGFRLAKEISAPIQALSLGTQRIADGDLAVRLENESADELGMLVQSFNTMAEDLEYSQERLNQANKDLARQNEQLEERRKYMEVVLNNITSGVISLDENDKISTVNKAAENILGVDAQGLLGVNPLELYREEYGSLLKEGVEGLKNAMENQWQKQMDLNLEKGERKLLVNAVALKTSSDEDIGMVIVFEDITELDKMQRMAAWREVARRIAHEIKNPLTPIKLSAQRLERKFGKDTEDKAFEESTRLIVRQVEQLQHMVQEFSSFAKLPEIELEYNSLTPLLQEVLSLFENSYTNINWELLIKNDLPDLKFDRSALKRVFINLMTNAAEVLKNVEDPYVEIIAEYNPETSWVSLEVRDNGPGFTHEENTRIFEPYFSNKKSNTGLGLTIVKSIVNDHNGYVHVRSQTPSGSIFLIQLPV